MSRQNHRQRQYDYTGAQGFPVLSREILRYAYRDVSRVDFLKECASLLLDFSRCEAIELRIRHGDRYYRCSLSFLPKNSCTIKVTNKMQHSAVLSDAGGADFERLCDYIYRGLSEPTLQSFTHNGSFWTGDTDIPLNLRFDDIRPRELVLGGDYKTLAIIPFVPDERSLGLMILKSLKKYYFTNKDIEFYEGVAQSFGVAVACRRSQADLRERLKELACLYDISKIAGKPDVLLPDILKDVVRILPPAMQHPEIASARIVLDGLEYATQGFKDTGSRLVSDILIKDKRVGVVEVAYLDEGIERGEDAFLAEEHNLLDAVTKKIGIIVGAMHAEQERTRLQEQLIHADRLVTLGQFSAGIAHELNDPLSRILGFAQLAQKAGGLPEQVNTDIEKIVNASLHARSIVKKLLIFTRGMPQSTMDVNINKIVSEESLFFESRCDEAGIEVVKDLVEGHPVISGDPVQVNQVLVNLVINAIQAMPQGGRLTIKTRESGDSVLIHVEDTGVGMSEDVRKKMFIPFFTTKGVGTGTGLGMSVVHGIVASHGGDIKVNSKLGEGSRIVVRFPRANLKEKE